MPSSEIDLATKIRKRTATVAILGAGYVGLSLAVEVATARFRTVAYDICTEKIELLRRGKSYVIDVDGAVVSSLVRSKMLSATTDPACVRTADVVIICVPTPLNKTKTPNVSHILSVVDAMSPHLRRGQLVVLESTVYPRFTREVLRPRLERTGLEVGRSLHLAFSPERVDPGNACYNTKNTPKVIGGMTRDCAELATELYECFIDDIVPVSSCDAAEMVKLLENTFRAVNIGLVNEVALMCEKLGLDTWEVIDAAATKPYGFMPFYPGPGLGGHCIPVDPHYLSWKLKTLEYNARFIELAGEINSSMPAVVVQLLADALNEREKPVKRSKVLVLGVAYKRDINDVRESPALDVIKLLRRRGADVSYHDPYVESLRTNGDSMRSRPLESVGSYDAVLLLTDHRCFDYPAIAEQAQLILDTRNAFRAQRADYADKIVTL